MASEKKDPERRVSLVHPLYLDAGMLISFLATLEDGASFSSEVAEKIGRNSKSSGEASAEGKLPSITSLLGLNLSASGKYSRDSGQDENVEKKFVRQHTAASLFNGLRDRLSVGEQVRVINGPGDLVGLEPGALIEMSGTVDESPLKKIVDAFRNLWPFYEEELAKTRAGLPNPKRNNKSGTPQEDVEARELARFLDGQLAESKQILRMIELIESDLERSPVVDLLLSSVGVSAMVTANRELLSDDVTAALMGGTFRVVGKLCAIDTAEDAETMVVRRGAMGAMAETAVLPMLEAMRKPDVSAPLNLALPEGKIRGPFVQIIPLSIFI